MRHMLCCALLFPLTAHRSPLTAVQIQDNSFLLEEAYNQEAGVVQHISAFARSSGGDWNYSFTQEWPLGGIQHQLSYLIPVQHAEGNGTGLGDVVLNYRYQLVEDPTARTLVAPRLSLILPTGNDRFERGAGTVGFQTNLPLTHVLSSRVVTHWNAGATVRPSANNALGQQATISNFNLGASLVWLVRPSFNLLVESVWLSEESVVGEDQTARRDFGLPSPGFRVAFDFPGDLQIVPGAAYTIGLGSSSSEDLLFLYLSFEHPFKHQ